MFKRLIIAISMVTVSAFAETYPPAYTHVYVYPLTANSARTILPLVVPAGYSTTGIINYTMLCRDFVHSQTTTGVASYSIVKDVNGHTVPNVVTTVGNNTATIGSIAGEIRLVHNTIGGYNLKAFVGTTGLSNPVCTIHFAVNALTD